MVEYRIYTIEKDGHIASPPQILEAEDDYTAVEKAQQFRDGKVIEIWTGKRLVVRLDPEK